MAQWDHEFDFKSKITLLPDQSQATIEPGGPFLEMVFGRLFHRRQWTARLRKWETLREEALRVEPRLVDLLPQPSEMDGPTLDVKLEAFQRLLRMKTAPREGR